MKDILIRYFCLYVHILDGYNVYKYDSNYHVYISMKLHCILIIEV